MGREPLVLTGTEMGQGPWVLTGSPGITSYTPYWEYISLGQGGGIPSSNSNASRGGAGSPRYCTLPFISASYSGGSGSGPEKNIFRNIKYMLSYHQYVSAISYYCLNLKQKCHGDWIL